MTAFNKPAMPLNRRHALMFLGANAWAMRPAWADAQGSAPGRLVLVFLRGALLPQWQKSRHGRMQAEQIV